MRDAAGLSVPMEVRELCEPSRTALIVYHMKVGVVSQISEGGTVTNRCAALLARARKAGFSIYFTRHQWLPNRLAGGQLRRAMIWQRAKDPAKTAPLFAPGSPAWQIVPELTPKDDECVIDHNVGF